ncbi:MAG: sulfatase-like hydrolase/transferase [Mariniblastus sp.]
MSQLSRVFLPLSIVFASALFSNQATVSAAFLVEDKSPPNIVVFLCDDLGYGDLECFGHPHIKTPNLNQMAADGIRFTDFYSAAPVCSSSRVGLLTGRNPNRAGVYDWIPPANKNARADGREQVHMRIEEATIPSVLKSAGYATCMAGKWHCNSRFNDKTQPQPGDFGFDHWLATQNNAAPSHKHPNNFIRNGKRVGKTESFSCNFVAKEASNWLRKHNAAKPEQPFFIYIAFHEPHEPVSSPKKLVDEYKPVAKSNDQAQYFANVANVDVAVGRFLKTLDELKLRENTLVIFTSDNGPETLNRYKSANRSFGTPNPLRGMKLHTHEAGFRVAGIMRWPNQIESGQTVSVPVSSLDFLPTFCDLAKTEKPDRHLDGANFLPALKGETIERAQPLFWMYLNAINQSRVAMRDGKWKVLARLDGGKFPRMQNVTPERMKKIQAAKLTDIEIYDLSTDVAESKNLAAEMPEFAKKQKEKLRELFDSANQDSHVWTPQ